MNAPDYGLRLGAADAARYSGLTERQLKTLRAARRVKFYKLGSRTVVYDRASLDALLAAAAVEALPAGKGA